MKYIVVENFPDLGKDIALSFLTWAQQHPEGVISLPTGKTPEYFIRWVKHIQQDWETPEIQTLLEKAGLDLKSKISMGGLQFVQMDEFYPIDPEQQNSFCNYVRRFYIDGFGLDPARALVIDCSRIGLKKGQNIQSVWPEMKVDLSLRTRAPQTQLEDLQRQTLHNIDQWCQEYEDAIREKGGIGFFLGGIGPDGHIAFNVRGSDHHSTTRLSEINYETQAAAATDLGGMEVARNRLVITIGLGTITANPECKAVLMAAGEAKAKLVADAIESCMDVRYPATALRKLSNAYFYVTKGAAKDITAYKVEQFQTGKPDIGSTRRILIDTAIAAKKRLTDLCENDLEKIPMGERLLNTQGFSLTNSKSETKDYLVSAIEKGMKPLINTTFLHTEPHHDDIMLGYLPAVVRNIREPSNRHFFITLTSGFTSVTNLYMKDKLKTLTEYMNSQDFKDMENAGYFDPSSEDSRNRDIWQYLDGVAAADMQMCEEGTARRLLRNLKEIYQTSSSAGVKDKIGTLIKYLDETYPGRKDIEPVQRLKGMCREWEVECLWGYFGWQCSNIEHLRLGFYKGDIFTEEPSRERDVKPVVEKLKIVRPDVVSVALDPEGSGPDTHYKVMQTLQAALDAYEKTSNDSDIRIWGYRNIWYRFHPAEMNLCVPVSMNMFSTMNNAFMNTFISQREASFPSYEYDGPFSALAQKIQVEQYQMLKTCLGREWFHDHSNAMIRATRGLVFIKEMDAQGFYEHSRAVRSAIT